MTAVRSGRRPLARVLIALVGGILALLAGCGGNNFPPPGTPVITMSSTNTHFASYTITLDSITLEADDGSFVTPLFTPVIVDLVRLSDIGELLGAPAVPQGTYLKAQITVDYTTAAIYADKNGTPVAVAPQAPGGATITTAVITVTFDPAHPLVITAPKSTHAHLTFDLEAFNTIDLSTSPGKVTIQPYAVMQPASAAAQPLRARGVFVVTQASSFVINTRPLYDYVSNPSGALTVNVTDKTYYNVNGVVYSGADGLAAMKGLNISTSLAAYGTLDDLSTITPSFNATSVYVGTALEGELQDHIIGVVSARSGNTLTVTNIQWLPVQNFSSIVVPEFLPKATVTLGSTTSVTEDGVEATAVGLASISVGQRVDISGLLSFDSKNNAKLDATTGQVRLQSTRAWGVLNSATPNSASLDLLSLGNFAPASYTFTGTAAGGGAVDPAAYLVNTGSIDESGRPAGTLLAVDGIVAAFGAAPPDLNATAITAGAATQQTLVVEWKGGATAPFSKHDASGIIVDLANTALDLQAIYTGPQSLDLKSLPASPLITTTGADQSQLLLAVGNATKGIPVFQSASAFATGLNSALNGSNKVYRLAAYGQYNSASNTFVATRIDVSLQN